MLGNAIHLHFTASAKPDVSGNAAYSNALRPGLVAIPGWARSIVGAASPVRPNGGSAEAPPCCVRWFANNLGEHAVANPKTPHQNLCNIGEEVKQFKYVCSKSLSLPQVASPPARWTHGQPAPRGNQPACGNAGKPSSLGVSLTLRAAGIGFVLLWLKVTNTKIRR